ENIPGTVVFLHQHAEEQPPGGAKPIVESGAIDHVDAVFGNHLWATTEFGKIETKEGAFMAGRNRFENTFKRKSGHGAYPHEKKKDNTIGEEGISEIYTNINSGIETLKNVFN